MDEIQEALRDIVAAIRGSLEDLTPEILEEQSAILDGLGYPYDDNTYPQLDFPEEWDEGELHEGWDVLDIPEGQGDQAAPGHAGAILNRPPALAEALLWKLGKWNSYVQFVQDFAEAPHAPLAGNRIVFQAFARHLRTTNLPIFDQHALRAMWAIEGIPVDGNWQACKAYLMNRNDVWNSNRPAGPAVTSYTWYCDQVARIPMAHNRAGMRAVDRLLMPLGKALRENSANLTEFTAMADW